MRCQIDASRRVVELVLSRRNLLALLHKLDMPGSARTIFKTDDGFLFTAKSETDAEHYGNRDVPPGEMHPATETFIAARKQLCPSCGRARQGTELQCTSLIAGRLCGGAYN